MTLALWHISPDESELRDVAFESDNVRAPELVKVTSQFSLISKGTEKLVATGLVDKQHETHMSVPYMEGSFSLPVKYGYSLVGKTDDERLVHLLHPHQEAAWVKPDALFYLPDDVSAQRMTLLSNMETIINACWDAEHFSDAWQNKAGPVVICGFGAIGSLLAVTLLTLGFSQVLVKDTAPPNSQLAASLGFTAIEETSLAEFPLIFHSSGSGDGLQWCINNAGLEGTIIELSWYGNKTCTLSLGADFHYNRLRLISSQVSQIPGHKPKESYHSRKSLAVELLKDDLYLRLMDAPVPFSQAPSYFRQLRTSQNQTPLQSTFCYNALKKE